MTDQANKQSESTPLLFRASVAFVLIAGVGFLLWVAIIGNPFSGEFMPWEKDDLDSYQGADRLISRLSDESNLLLYGDKDFPRSTESWSAEHRLLQADYAMDMVIAAIENGDTTYKELLPTFELVKSKAQKKLGDVKLRVQIQKVEEARNP